MAIVSEAGEYDMVAGELEKKVAELSCYVLAYYWDVRDRKAADEVGPKQWLEESRRYARWSEEVEDKAVDLLRHISFLSRLANDAGCQLVNAAG